jgi:esterase/lipase
MRKCLLAFYTICLLQPIFSDKIDLNKIYEYMISYRITDQCGFINYYLLPSENGTRQKNLMIFIDGSSTISVLGVKSGNVWKTATVTSFLRLYFDKTFDILVSEKYNVDFGNEYDMKNKKIMDHYTLKDRVNSSLKVIDAFLEKNNEYENCYLFGMSEGSILTAKIYNNLKRKDRIKKIILCSQGGLSQYECFKIQYESYDPNYKKQLENIDRVVDDIKKNPGSLTKSYLGWTYKRWSDFMFYRPIDDIEKIEIPILVMHGDNDINAPVESSRYIKEVFDKKGKTNLTYKEYKDKDHVYNGDFGFMVEEIENWLKTP